MAFTKVEVENLKKRVKKGEVLEALKELEIQNDGMITPHEVVNAARNKNSKLHHLFDWDDSKAAEKYRLMQARIVLTTVTIEYMGEKREAFFNARVDFGTGEKVQGYFPIERVMSEKEIHDEVLRQAVRDLEYAQQKYKSLQEFRGVINTRKLAKIKKKL